ncbi:NAD(P)-binding protein, partial [Neisseria sp. P0021.S007]|uniref:NAD(P)-binding protein n=1 Tax=Neisseria sp. P0021.S007 TaxID=3436822 RepID=UPI003F81195A
MLTRRQFLSYTAALGAASAFSWQTYKYLNRKPPVSINRVGLPLGHLLRDRELLQAPPRRYECNTLILGGGAAGLGALWYLAKHNHCDVLLAEGFERNGNNAAYTSSDGMK